MYLEKFGADVGWLLKDEIYDIKDVVCFFKVNEIYDELSNVRMMNANIVSELVG